MNVVVKTVTHQNQLKAASATKCRQIFNMMTKSLGIQEYWYFGLMFEDNKVPTWVDSSKKSLKDIQRHIQNLNFLVKYYPEDIVEELIERVTIEYFYNQVKNDIVSDKLYCPPDTCALLASYTMQIKYGNYDPNQHTAKNIKIAKLFPERVIKQHSMSDTDWFNSLTNMWKRHKGYDEEELMLEYLRLAQNLDLFGVTFFDIQNKKGTDLLLGVTALGLNVYKIEDRINPHITFPWSEIKKLDIKDKKFTIKPISKTADDFVFFTSSPRICKTILNLGIGNHSLYVKRRKPEAPEITKLREKAKAERENRIKQGKELNRERLAREEAELRESRIREEIEKMRLDMERSQANLLEAQRTIQQLQKQLDELQRSKEELEKQRLELEKMMERLEQSKNMEAEERQRMEDEIRAKHEEVQRIQEEVRLKDEETRRLQEQVEEAKRLAEEERLRKEEEERLRRESEEEAERLRIAALESLKNDDGLPEIHAVQEDLKDELKILQEKLEETRDESAETELDRIHKVNLTLGRDKYKTLADIRRGNTTRRVELFENL